MIEVSKLTVKLDNKAIFKNLSFTLSDGENVAVLGPSGEGKSVLIRCILGLIRPDSGTVKVDGVDIHNSEENEVFNLRKKMGVLFQGSALFDFMTVGENVEFPLLANSEIEKVDRDEMVYNSLKLVKLEESMDKMPNQLSGGMQKRVALSRAVVSKPRYLFYDEPTSGLDPIRARIINKLIMTLNKKYKVSSMTITHDMSSLGVVADKILFLYKGEILFFDSIEKIGNNKILKDFISGKGDID